MATAFAATLAITIASVTVLAKALSKAMVISSGMAIHYIGISTGKVAARYIVISFGGGNGDANGRDYDNNVMQSSTREFKKPRRLQR